MEVISQIRLVEKANPSQFILDSLWVKDHIYILTFE